MDDSSKKSFCIVSNAQSWPAIDYSCLQRFPDPSEFFSVCKMLQNAENEVKKLKGELSPSFSQPQGRRDRQRRPGLVDFDGKKNVFKFPAITATVEASLEECPTQSSCVDSTELTIASRSTEICKFKNSDTVEPESQLTRNIESHDSDIDKEIDELEKLLIKCRDLDNDSIAKFVRETIQINPIHVEKSIGFPLPITTEDKLGSPQLCSPVTNRNKIDGLPKLNRRLSLINCPGDPSFPPRNNQEKLSNGLDEIICDSKNFHDDGLEKIPSSERGKNVKDLENIKVGLIDLSVDEMPESEYDAEKTANPVHLSASKKSIPLMDIQGKLAEISTLKKMLLGTTEGQQLSPLHDLEDSSLSKSREIRSFLSENAAHSNDSSMNDQHTCIPALSDGKRSIFEGEIHSPAAKTFAEDKNLSEQKISVPKGCRLSLLDGACQRLDSAVFDASFKKAGQASASVDHRPLKSLADHPSDNLLHLNVNTDPPEQILHAEAPEEEHPASIDKQLGSLGSPSKDMPSKDTNASTKNRLEASAGSANRKLERMKPPRRLKKQNSILRRKSLAGAGTKWDSGVRRSTRIKTKPLKHWCGERFLYGRVHDSLATVVGVQKYETPQKGRKAVMKVMSYLSEEYADLVSRAALY